MKLKLVLKKIGMMYVFAYMILLILVISNMTLLNVEFITSAGLLAIVAIATNVILGE